MQEETVQVPKPKKNIKKTIIFAVVTLIVLSAGIVAGLLLVRQPQDFREKAAVPTGTARIYLTPETKTISAGETFTATILFDTAGIAISGLTVKLEYPYTGDEPPISATSVEINPSLVLDSNWDFPYKNITEEGGAGKIEIAGLSTSTAGYTTDGQENLATITFRGNRSGTINVSFNANESVIASKDAEEDILLIPQSSGTYIVSGGSQTSSPTPTSSPSPSPSSTGTGIGTTGSASPTATAPPVPVTGVGDYMIFGMGAGVVLITIAALLL